MNVIIKYLKSSVFYSIGTSSINYTTGKSLRYAGPDICIHANSKVAFFFKVKNFTHQG